MESVSQMVGDETSKEEIFPFYAVAIGKFWLLYICTFGIFSFVWFYKNWRVYKERRSLDISPFWRSLFSGIFVFPFFQYLKSDFDRHDLRFSANPILLGIIFLVSGPLSRLPDYYWLLTFISVMPIAVGNDYLLRYNRLVYNLDTNKERISIVQWAIIIFGFSIFLFAFLGTLAELKVVKGGSSTPIPEVAEIREIYRDQYYENDYRYINRTIGFSLTFIDFWEVHPHVASMPDEMKILAKNIGDEGGELIFFAMSSDGSAGARGIVEEANLPLEQFYKVIYEVNRSELEHISYDTIKMGTTEMVRWIYRAGAFTYQEYQVKKDKNNMRITFWAPRSLFDDYKDDFHKIASTFRTKDN